MSTHLRPTLKFFFGLASFDFCPDYDGTDDDEERKGDGSDGPFGKKIER